MSMLQRQTQGHRLQQRADPQLLLTNRILQMSTLELRQCVLHELAENPALDSAEGADCGNCGLGSMQCLTCPAAIPTMRLEAGAEARDTAHVRQPYAGEVEVDPLSRVEAPQTLQEHLLRQLNSHCQDASELRAGRYLIANINEDGYLQCSTEEAADLTGNALHEVEEALAQIQNFDPPGVGARSLRECLLIQARSRPADDPSPPCLVALLENCWKELGSARWTVVARRLRVSVKEVEETVSWLRRNLSPYPGRQYRPDWGEVRRADTWIRPDVIVQREEDGRLVLELARDDAPALQVNPQYALLWDEMRARPDAFNAAERRHLQDYLFRAQMFLKSVRDRTSILRQVCECVLEEQEPFFVSESEEDMRPLTQSQLASFLRVHESTVSRAVADKYLQLPSGRVVPLSYFFDRALSHRALVANVVASEDPASPLSDQQIADILRRKGVVIARRTVMKYREELNILSSRQRGRASSL